MLFLVGVQKTIYEYHTKNFLSRLGPDWFEVKSYIRLEQERKKEKLRRRLNTPRIN